jgi:Flp pilus assembly protein TadG
MNSEQSMKARETFRLLSEIAKLVRDETGTVIVQFTVYLVVIFGMIGLALEGAQLFLLHNDLQDLADAAAIAGAKDLDGTNNAFARDDAQNYVTNQSIATMVSITDTSLR